MYDVAVGVVVRGVRRAVDEVDVIPLLHDEPAVGRDIPRTVARKRGGSIVPRAARKRRQRERRNKQNGQYLSEFFQHRD